MSAERPECVDCQAPADIRELGSGEARCWDCHDAQKKREASTCQVVGCDRPIRARGACSMHYKRALNAGRLASLPRPLQNDDTPLVCVCADPAPFGIGECRHCHRPVVTFMSVPNAAEVWPVEFERAVRLGAVPRSFVLPPKISALIDRLAP